MWKNFSRVLRFRDVFNLVVDDDDIEDANDVKVLSPKKSKKTAEEKAGKKRHAPEKSKDRQGSSRTSSDDEQETVAPSKPKKHRNKSPPMAIDWCFFRAFTRLLVGIHFSTGAAFFFMIS